MQIAAREHGADERASGARRHSRVLAERAADPAGDEAEVMRWIEDVSDTTGWKA